MTTLTLDAGPQTAEENLNSYLHPDLGKIAADCQHKCDVSCKTSGCSHSCGDASCCNNSGCDGEANCTSRFEGESFELFQSKAADPTARGKNNFGVLASAFREGDAPAEPESGAVVPGRETFVRDSSAGTSLARSCCSQNCKWSECEFCNSTESFTAESEFSRDVAELLRVALKNQDLDDPSSRKVIENAMALVVKNAQTKANAEISKLKIEHEKELASFRGQLLQMSTQMKTVDDFKNWLGPLYTNQNRTIQQIQMLAYGSNTINRTLSLLEKQMSTNDSVSSVPVKYGNRPINQDKMDSEVYDLNRQVYQLKKQLQQLQSRDVQPANHLEPIFDNEQPKSLDIPWPSEESWRHNQFRH